LLFEHGNEFGRVWLATLHHPWLGTTGGHTGETCLNVGATVVVSAHSTSACSGTGGWCSAVGVDALASGLTSNAVKSGIARSVHSLVHLSKHALISSASLVAVSH
jgi:hypothetical protein